MGLVNRLTTPGHALAAAVELGQQLAAFPQTCLRNDRLSVYGQSSLDLDDALVAEYRFAISTIDSGETRHGAARFAAGEGRHGVF